MMSKKKWFVLLCLFIVYLLLGAGIFYNIESLEESKRMDEERKERENILGLLDSIGITQFEHSFFKNLTEYCGKPLGPDMKDYKGEPIWDFYHSLFFVITVVSTIGYGNLAPTTMFGRIFMIFYALIGIPMNGIVMVTLGGFFGRSFTKLYQRWKTSKMKYDTTRLGLISQIILYAVPGATFFIFLPAGIIVIFEGWAYDVAVYYAFVTLTTIGFGDYVAGVAHPHDIPDIYFRIYQVFLLVWILGGLGYVVMILGFITQGMQSKKLRQLEQAITNNIKKTPVKIRQELRTVLQEFLFLRVKPVYKGEFEYVPTAIQRSQSCPDLTIYRNLDSPSMARKRAFSEGPRTFFLHRIQSDSNLQKIDRERTFSQDHSFTEQQELIRKVVDALGNIDNESPIGGYEGFTDEEILASERYTSQWSLKSQTPSLPVPKRRRAVSEVKVPPAYRLETEYEHTWYGQEATDQFASLQDRIRTQSEPSSLPIVVEAKPPASWLTRIKNKFMATKDERLVDVEKQEKPRKISAFTSADYIGQTSRGRPSILSIQQEAVLEQTSIADFIRALSAITVPETMLPTTSSGPKRKLGTAGISPPRLPSPPRVRRLAIRPNVPTRRTSLIPNMSPTQSVRERRRFSLRPVEENLLVPPPPPYSPPTVSSTDERVQQPRKFSKVSTTTSPSVIVSPVQRQVFKKEKDDNNTNC